MKVKEEELECIVHLVFHSAEIDKLISMGVSPRKVRKLGFKVLDFACKFIKEVLVAGLENLADSTIQQLQKIA